MTGKKMEIFIRRHTVYHTLITIALILITVSLRAFKVNLNTTLTVALVTVILLFHFVDSILNKMNYFDSRNVFIYLRLTELMTYSIIQSFVSTNNLLLPALMLVCVLLSIEFIVYCSDYEAATVYTRRLVVLAPVILNISLALGRRTEAVWFCYLFVQALMVMLIYYIVDWLHEKNKDCEHRINELYYEKSQIENMNERLVDYQEKVKMINEQINYQKIDLARANKELEQANIEIASQTDVMKYMASTFDILKCINVITDAIMEVMKPRLCALYIDKDVYMNKYSSCIIKTNYSSLQRRLKKEIEGIYTYFAKNKKESVICTADEIAEFKFVGDTNINAIAILPLFDNKKIYGIMIVGSDNSEFFKNGLNFYETCIVEFNVAIKSTKLFLKMEDMARKDGLTGIYNRLYFNELFKKACEQAKRKKEYLSVALFDIDKFKNVNDTYGHLAGDEVIKMVASVDKEFAELYNGFACRYGGEEFLLVLPGMGHEAALSILESLHEKIKTNIVRFEDKEISVNVCIGLSSFPEICIDPSILVSRADKAMYYGKRNGRGRLVLDNPEIDNLDLQE